MLTSSEFYVAGVAILLFIAAVIIKGLTDKK